MNATNNYALTLVTRTPVASRHARIRKWTPTNTDELKRFFELIIFMGLVKLGELYQTIIRPDYQIGQRMI